MRLQRCITDADRATGSASKGLEGHDAIDRAETLRVTESSHGIRAGFGGAEGGTFGRLHRPRRHLIEAVSQQTRVWILLT